MSDGPRGECVENEVTVTGLGEPFVFYILSQTKDDGIKVRDRLRDMVAKARAEAFEEAALLAESFAVRIEVPYSLHSTAIDHASDIASALRAKAKE